MANPSPFAEAEADDDPSSEAPRTRGPETTPHVSSGAVRGEAKAKAEGEGEGSANEEAPPTNPTPPGSLLSINRTSRQGDWSETIRGRGLKYLGELGSGGMGRVDRYYDPTLDRELAVKVLRDNGDEAKRRFRWESQIGGQLQHPGIVPIYEAGDFADGRSFLAMKLVKGRTLHDLLKARSDPGRDLSRFLVIFEQICQAVAYAHSRRVIHRDLKPSNVMVGAFGEVQVMDWGLAKVLRGDPENDGDGEKTTEKDRTSEPPGTVIRTNRDSSEKPFETTPDAMGTPAYMAPEQARGEIGRLSPRTDVFALGSILCEILTGQPAFSVKSSGEAIAQSQRGDLAGVFERLNASGADSELIALARQCLAPERDDRPENAQAVSNRMAAHFEGVREQLRRAELVRAQAEARAESERRARRMTMMAAGLLIAILIGSGGGWLYRDRLRGATARSVSAALQEAQVLVGQAKEADANDLSQWKLALNAVQRARVALETGVSDPKSAEIVRAWAERIEEGHRQAESDLAFLERLGDAQSRGFDSFEVDRGCREYEEAFRKAGWEPKAMPAEKVKDWSASRGRRVLEEISFFLDDWMSCLSQLPKDDPRQASGDWIMALLREIDPDPWRGQVRREIKAENHQELSRLAGDAAFRRGRSPRDSILLGSSLLTKDREAAKAVYQDAWREEPGNYWICLGLAVAEWDGSKFDSAERASRYASMAMAARPKAIGSRVLCGLILIAQGQIKEAEALLSKSVEMNPHHDYARLTLGMAYRGLERLDEAEVELRKAIGIDPNSFAAHNQLGLVYEDQEKHDEAAEQFRLALKIEPDNALAQSNLGLTLTNQKKYEEAVAILNRAVKLDPKSATAFNNLGFALNRMGKYDEGMAALRESIKLDPTDGVAQNNIGFALNSQGKHEEAIPYLRESIERDPKFSLAHRNLGFALNGLKRYEEAIPCFRKAIELDPEYAVAHNNLGFALIELEKPKDAEDMLRKAIELDPSDSTAFNNLGYALIMRERFEEAAVFLRKAIEIKPSNSIAHANLGWALNSQGEYEQALAPLSEAIKLDPNNPYAHNNLGWALVSLGRFEPAIAACLKSIELKPDLAIAHTNLGQAYHGMKRYDEAIASYRKGVAIDPKNSIIRNNLAFALIGRKQFEEAIPLLREAIALDSKNAFAHSNLGKALYEIGEVENAVPPLRKSMELAPKLAPPRAHLANALSQAGRTEEAIAACREALAIDPKNALAHLYLGQALQSRGDDVAGVRAALREGQALGETLLGWETERVARLIADVERRLTLKDRLPDILKGAKPDDRELTDFAALSWGAKRHSRASELYEQAFAANPGLATDLNADPHELAIRAAALAGLGQGTDEPPPDDASRAKLRDLARRRLKAVLESWNRRWKSERVEDRRAAAQALRTWRIHRDLEDLRDPKRLEQLPLAERQAWRELWAEADRMIATHPSAFPAGS